MRVIDLGLWLFIITICDFLSKSGIITEKQKRDDTMASRGNTPAREDILSFIGAASTHQFVIPVYQRHYDWKAKEQVNVLLDDIYSMINSPVGKTHFTGIIMYLRFSLRASFGEIQIIDGQQRITTVFLLLWAIYEIAEEMNDDETKATISQYLFNDKNIIKSIPGDRYHKLKPLVSDNSVYKKIIAGGKLGNISETEKNTNVYMNYDHIKKYIKSHINVPLMDVVNALEKMDIVTIPLDQEDDAQQIFESINKYGMPLDQADLIRNFVLMGIESDEQETLYSDYWLRIEQVYGEDKSSFKELFRFYTSLKLLNLIDGNYVYENFVKHWNDCIDKGMSKEEILNEIFDYAECYKFLYKSNDINPIYKFTASEVEILKDFRNIHSLTIAPFILEIDYLWSKNQITKEQFIRMLQLMNTYLIRRTFANASLNDASRYFPQLLKNVMKECNGDYQNLHNITLKYLVNINKNNTLGMPLDKIIVQNMATANAYTNKYLKMILTRIDNYNKNGKPITPITDYSDLTVEHIMPQTSNSYWQNVVGQDGMLNYPIHVNNLGNLTLVSKNVNSAMGNDDFDSKKDYLKNSGHILMNTPILGKKKWDYEEISNRCSELIKVFNIIYPYEEAKIEKTIVFKIHYTRKNIPCSAEMYYDGTVIVMDECKLGYKANSKHANNDIYKNSLANGLIVVNDDLSVTLVSKAKFGNINELSNLLNGIDEKPLKYWHDEDDNEIGNSIYNLIK